MDSLNSCERALLRAMINHKDDTMEWLSIRNPLYPEYTITDLQYALWTLYDIGYIDFDFNWNIVVRWERFFDDD